MVSRDINELKSEYTDDQYAENINTASRNDGNAVRDVFNMRQLIGGQTGHQGANGIVKMKSTKVDDSMVFEQNSLKDGAFAGLHQAATPGARGIQKNESEIAKSLATGQNREKLELESNINRITVNGNPDMLDTTNYEEAESSA